MGLDAHVNCDCFEKGRLKTQPRPEWGVYVGPDGGRWTTATTLDLELAFDWWNNNEACEHEYGILLHRVLGNVALIATFRRLLGQYPDDFRILLECVVYSGTHGGDFLSIEQVKETQLEIEHLSRLHAEDQSEEAYLREFERALRELTECALKLNKPVVF